MKKEKRKAYILFGLAGFLCAFLWKAEKDLAGTGNILWTGRYVADILLFSLFAGILVGGVIGYLVHGVPKDKWSAFRKKCFPIQRPAPDATEEEKRNKTIGKSRKIFLVSLLLILLSWIPCYLAYYPAICAYDTTIQTGQIESGSYNDHHPIAHTLLLQGAMNLGETLFGSVNTGVAVYTAFQMLFLAVSFAYGIALLHRLHVKKGWQAVLLLYGMFYPFHWFMGVSVIKDTVFSAFFLLQMLSLCVLLLRGEKERLFSGSSVLFSVSTAGMILFRNNGKYAMLVMLVFLLLMIWRGKAHRRVWTRIFSCSFIGFLTGNILLSVLFSVTGAQQGDKREMLSMPIQQMARCMIYHGGVGVLAEDDGTMNEESKALIRDFLLNESYREYRPDISDPVKRHTNTYVPRYRSGDFIRTYLKLFGQYPGDYINAVLAVNAGYLSPGDETHAHINENGVESGLGYVQTRWVESELNPRGIFKASKWEWLHEKLEDWADGNAYLDIPILKYLFVPGTYLWCYLFLACFLIVFKKYRMLLPLSLVMGYYITLFLGPTVQMRYLYPVMIALPFTALLSFAGKQEGEDLSEKNL